ncbi:MAG: M16 family metallopeptidase [Candidatus Ranarchaeia archaeon]
MSVKKPDENVILHRLNNGVKIVVDNMPHSESVTVALAFGVGSRYETDDIAGISHLLEHMFFKGTKTRSYGDISRQFDKLGALVNAFTQRDMTVYYAKAPYENFHGLIDLWADMLNNSILDANEFRKEREVVLQEYMRYLDNGPALAYSKAYKACFPNSPLGRPVIGTESSIRSITRDKLKRFWDEMYTANNLIIAVVGRVDSEAVISGIDRAFGSMAPAATARYNRIAASGADKIDRKSNHVILFPDDKEDTHIAFSARTLSAKDPEYASLPLTNAMVAESKRSPIYKALITDRGLASRVSSDFELFPDTGIFILSASVSPKHASQSIKIIEEILESYTENEPSREMLTLSKRQVAGRLALDLEDTFDLAVWYIQMYFRHQKLLSPRSFIEDLQGVTSSMVYRRFKQIFSDRKMYLTVVGNIPSNQVAKITLKRSDES